MRDFELNHLVLKNDLVWPHNNNNNNNNNNFIKVSVRCSGENPNIRSQ